MTPSTLHTALLDRLSSWLAVSVLEALPEEDLPGLSEALSAGEEAVEAYLAEKLPNFESMLADSLSQVEGTNI
jgi:hypothetical protein